MQIVKMFDRYTEIEPYMSKKGFSNWFDNDDVIHVPGNDCAVWYNVMEEEEIYEEYENCDMVKAFNQFFLDNGCEIGELVWIDITW